MDKVQPPDPVEDMRASADVFGWRGRLEYASAFEHERLNALLALWRDKAGARLPARAAFHARELKFILPHLWMLEEVLVGAACRYRFRRVGTAVATVFGEHTGKFIDDVLPPNLLPRWTTACEALLRCPAPVRVTTNVDLPGADYLSLESFHAPLLDSHRVPTILMCASYFARRTVP